MVETVRGGPDPESVRLAVLTEAARSLHAEPDPDRVVEWALDAAARLTASDEVAICRLPRHGSPEWTRPRAVIDFSLLEDPRASPLLCDALDNGSVLVLDEVEEVERQLPAGSRVAGAMGIASLVLVTVMARDGLAQGAILLGADRRGPADPLAVAGLAALAAHLGVALDNTATLARMAEVEAKGKEVVHALQEAVRPPAPVLTTTELGVHYVAADPNAPTGGDLYDWVTLPTGILHVVVVDVMGKGVEATKHALAVTHALRLLAVEGCPLEDLVARADALLTAQNPDLVATLLVVHYDPSNGDVRLAGAGHPPALIVSGSGLVHEVAAPGIPIGWPGAGSHEVVDAHLERSDTLVLYTDGLIEATKDIVQGLDDLAASAAATFNYPATSMARALVDRQLADAARHDDSLALVLRRRSPAMTLPRHALAPFRHEFTPQVAAVPVARHLLRDWLRMVPVEADAIDSLLLATSELCSNAVRHASGEPRSVRLRAWTETDTVHIEVSDDGASLAWPDQRPVELPDPEAERGRGLFLVTELADEVVSVVEDGRTAVRICKRAVVGLSGHPVTVSL